jgi:2-methylcitrate dehydratase PrpD
VQGSLLISLKGGQVKSKRIQWVYGHPKKPISQEDLVDKFMDCAKHSVKKFSKRTLDKIVALILSLEEIEDISELTRYL